MDLAKICHPNWVDPTSTDLTTGLQCTQLMEGEREFHQTWTAFLHLSRWGWVSRRGCCVVSLLIPERIYISRSLPSLNLSNPLSLQGNPVCFPGIHVATILLVLVLCPLFCQIKVDNTSGQFYPFTPRKQGKSTMTSQQIWPSIGQPRNCSLLYTA